MDDDILLQPLACLFALLAVVYLLILRVAEVVADIFVFTGRQYSLLATQMPCSSYRKGVRLSLCLSVTLLCCVRSSERHKLASRILYRQLSERH